MQEIQNIDNPIHVVITFDRNFLPHAAAMIASVFSNMRSSDYVIIHVMHTDLTSEHQQKLCTLEKLCPLRAKVEFTIVDLDLLNTFPKLKNFPVAAFFRLLIQDLFPDLARVIYLDVDMIVRCSLAELWMTDLKDNLVGAVELEDSISHEYDRIGIRHGIRFNAGVILFNLAAMRLLSIWDIYIQALEEFKDKTSADDQKLLNHVMANKMLVLSCKWNHTTSIYRDSVFFTQYGKQQLLEAIDDPCIIHFTGRRKPWLIERDRHGYAMEYWHYLAMTPWRYRCWRKIVKALFWRRNKIEADSTQSQLKALSEEMDSTT